MSYLYGRRIEVEVAGLEISEPRITVELSREIDDTEDRGHVSIYNLSEENEERIRDRGGPIRIQAGYPGRLGVIFAGAVQRVVRVREDRARITRIAFSDQVHAAERLGGTFMASLSGPTNVRQLVKDIVTQGLGLDVGPLDLIPADASVTNFWWSGPASGALNAALRSTGVRWFEVDGIVRFNRPGMAQSDASNVAISPQTGLIDSPVVTDEGAEIRTFLNAAIVPGCVIELESVVLSGRWKVNSMRHSGDNWSGPFETFCDLRDVAG